MKTQLVLFGALGTLAIAGCQTGETGQQASYSSTQTAMGTSRAALAQTDTDGVPMLVNAVCGSCHAVTPGALSPLPQAPTFPAIANRNGLTRETLSTYLRDAHNYPDIMDVGLDDEDVRLVTEYIISLRDAEYRPTPS